MYFLNQREVVHDFFKKWGRQEEAIAPNDILCVMEIMSMEKNCDRTIAVLNFTTEDSETRDNPSYKPILYFGEVAMEFNTSSLLFETPANKHKIAGHKELLANDHQTMDILHSRAWIKKTWEFEFPAYTKMNKLYKEETGGVAAHQKITMTCRSETICLSTSIPQKDAFIVITSSVYF